MLHAKKTYLQTFFGQLPVFGFSYSLIIQATSHVDQMDPNLKYFGRNQIVVNIRIRVENENKVI